MGAIQQVLLGSTGIGGGNLATTKLLCHFDGANAATATVDSSPSGRAIIRVGSATLSTAQAKFGPTATLLGAADGWSVASSADIDPTAGDVACDFWFYPTTLASNSLLFGTGSSSSTYTAYTYSDGRICIGNFGATEIASAAGALVTGSWQHLEFSRASGTTKIFVNGTSVVSSATDWTKGQATFYVGAAGSSGAQGYIDEFRWRNTTGHTANFTPPLNPYS